MKLKIALSGSAGTGKTTLGRRIAHELALPFVEEGMRTRLEHGLDLHGLSVADWRALIEDLWREQHAAEQRAGAGFVSDRSSFDYAAFWMHYGLYEDAALTEAWMERMFADVQRYDRILLFAWGSLPLCDDGVRSTNRWTQLRYQSILEGLVERFAAPASVLRVPATDDLDARVAFVLQELAPRGRGHLDSERE